MGNGQDDEPIQIILWPQRGCPIALFFLVIVAMTIFGANPCFAESQRCPSPPPYEQLRYEEDYSYLLNRSCRTDPWDIIKYISLSERGDWFFSLGGEVRERYEYFDNYLVTARRKYQAVILSSLVRCSRCWRRVARR